MDHLDYLVADQAWVNIGGLLILGSVQMIVLDSVADFLYSSIFE